MLIEIFILFIDSSRVFISHFTSHLSISVLQTLGNFPYPIFASSPSTPVKKIIYTRYAHLLGLPNFIYGIFYYVVSFVLVISDPNSYIRVAFILIAWFVVGFGVYLIYVLIRVLKVNCVLCFISHGLNFLLAISFTIREFLQ
jgi:uncharacterized membrane protein